MGLNERRKIKELQEVTFPGRVKEIEEICGAAHSLRGGLGQPGRRRTGTRLHRQHFLLPAEHGFEIDLPGRHGQQGGADGVNG